jgi:hypothetical protein
MPKIAITEDHYTLLSKYDVWFSGKRFDILAITKSSSPEERSQGSLV